MKPHRRLWEDCRDRARAANPGTDLASQHATFGAGVNLLLERLDAVFEPGTAAHAELERHLADMEIPVDSKVVRFTPKRRPK